MKRLCVYLTYDKQNVVDHYIGYMLKELKTCSDHLVAVCNMRKVVSGLKNLEDYADEIFYRDNVGFDAGGFKDALCCLIGWEKVWSYDELILVNDSMFGPFIPMTTIFDQMEKKEADFWGLIKHGEKQSSDIGYLPEHIQSFFLVVRSRMLHCSEFKDYWMNMPYYASFHRTVIEHEIKFTQYFAKLGYSYTVLADTNVNDSINSVNNYAQYGAISYELIRKRNFPFLKKKPLLIESLKEQTQENLRQSLLYIEKRTNYNINLIWDNIIRTMNMTDLQKSLHLQYIISQDERKICDEKVKILVFVTYKDSTEYILDYLKDPDLKRFVTIFAETQGYLNAYQNMGFECKKISFAEIAKTLSEFSSYDYVCVLNDTDMTSDRRSSCIGKSYFYNVWENLIKNRDHISGILRILKKEPRLGFLTTPQPNFSDFFGEYGKGWNGKFEIIQTMIWELRLDCQISEDCPPFRIAENFWIRGRILKKLKYMEQYNYACLPYIWIYLAQDAGYYSGIVESSEYASMNEVNLNVYLDKIAGNVRRFFGDFSDFLDFQKVVFRRALNDFCEKYEHIYIYGAGYLAKQYKTLINHVEAFIVTDGQEKAEMLEGLRVLYLSEVEVSEDIGIIICLSNKYQVQVIPLLEEKGLKNYLCI